METPPKQISFVKLAESRRKIFKQSSIEDTSICDSLNSPENDFRDKFQHLVWIKLELCYIIISHHNEFCDQVYNMQSITENLSLAIQWECG